MRVIRIVETPYGARVMAWWEGLSTRERWLVGTLATLLAVIVLVYGVIKPLQAARASAIADIRTYETLNARLRAAGTLAPAGPPPRTGPPETIVGAAAGGFGIAPAITTVPGGVRATFTDVPYDSLMTWMADVARTSNLAATRVEIRRAAMPGRVSAIVEFRG